MKTENNFWKTFAIILIVVIVVGVVVVFWENSVFSPAGVIKVDEKRRGTEVYTKEEIDVKFDDGIFKQVLIRKAIIGAVQIGDLVSTGEINTITTPNYEPYNSSEKWSQLVLTSSKGKVKIEGNLSVTNLEGNGNAYVCVDSSGRIYRSLTPCR